MLYNYTINLDSVLVLSIMSNDVKIARYFSRVLCLVVISMVTLLRGMFISHILATLPVVLKFSYKNTCVLVYFQIWHAMHPLIVRLLRHGFYIPIGFTVDEFITCDYRLSVCQ